MGVTIGTRVGRRPWVSMGPIGWLIIGPFVLMGWLMIANAKLMAWLITLPFLLPGRSANRPQRHRAPVRPQPAPVLPRQRLRAPTPDTASLRAGTADHAGGAEPGAVLGPTGTAGVNESPGAGADCPWSRAADL